MGALEEYYIFAKSNETIQPTPTQKQRSQSSVSSAGALTKDSQVNLQLSLLAQVDAYMKAKIESQQ